MVAASLLGSALTVSACGPTTTAGAPPVAATTTASSTSDPGAAPTVAPAGSQTSPLPPSGEWNLEVRVARDTCSPKTAVGLAETDLVVLSHRTSAGKIILNLPFVTAKGTSVARMDVFAEVGATITAKTNPDPACPSYEVERTATVTSVAHDRIVVRRVTRYGDRAVCPPQPPSICETELDYTYVLARAECELPCTGQVDLAVPKAPKVKCICP